jgi:hypothetical protein
VAKPPSWRKVAEALAERLEHAAGAAGSASPYDTRLGTTGCSHKAADADPDNCPFCADRTAFQLYKAKLRSTTTGSSPSGGQR